jgi:hypothetical protein
VKLKEQILALLKTLGYDPGDKKADLEKALDALDVPAQTPAVQATAAAATVPDPALKGQIDILTQKVNDLTGILTKEREQRETIQKTIAEQAKADQAKKVTDTLATHEKAGRIIPAMKDHFKKMLETDFETGSKILEALPVDPAAKKAADAAATKETGSDKGKTDETAPTGLEKMVPSAMMKGIRELTTATNN